LNISIRQADLQSDRALLIDTLLRYLTPHSDGRRFDWLYKNNPYGQAQVWLAIDSDNNAVVGASSAFPRRIYVKGVEEIAWVLGDFCINDRYRSLGPAVQLQRTCLSEIDCGKVAFCYDFPSTSMMAVYKRLGIRAFGEMLRLAKPLRMDRIIKKVIKSARIASALSIAGNSLMELYGRKRKGGRLWTIATHEGYCGEEFSTLAKEIGGGYGVSILRSADYLNWRYLANPLHRYELVTARRDNCLIGYAVFTHRGEDADLVDLFGHEDSTVISDLVDSVVALLRARGVITLNAPMIESHPWVPLIERLGFSVREGSPIVVYVPHSAASTLSMFEHVKWFIMNGDRDS
jgi:hypothetical protein